MTRSPSKRCFKCGQEKDRSEFYAHKNTTDGLLGKCKDCTKRDVSKYRDDNRGRLKRYEESRAALPHRRELNVEISRAWRAADKRRQACHNAVARALASGELRKEPCVRCGNSWAIAHHEDYDKPLEVMWLCHRHHKQRHAEIRRGE